DDIGRGGLYHGLPPGPARGSRAMRSERMRLPRQPREEHRLELGPDVIERLIPHRRPLIMVDRVRGFELGERPTLWATRNVSANEPVFDGHFPGLHIWPGIYTQE